MYCTLANVQERYPSEFLIQLASLTSTLDAAAQLVITQAIEDASAEIDAYSSQYDFESPYPELITKLCVEMTINNLLRRIEQSGGDGEYKARKEWIDGILEKLMKGLLEFDGVGDEDVSTGIQIDCDDSREW